MLVVHWCKRMVSRVRCACAQRALDERTRQARTAVCERACQHEYVRVANFRRGKTALGRRQMQCARLRCEEGEKHQEVPRDRRPKTRSGMFLKTTPVPESVLRFLPHLLCTHRPLLLDVSLSRFAARVLAWNRSNRRSKI